MLFFWKLTIRYPILSDERAVFYHLLKILLAGILLLFALMYGKQLWKQKKRKDTKYRFDLLHIAGIYMMIGAIPFVCFMKYEKEIESILFVVLIVCFVLIIIVNLFHFWLYQIKVRENLNDKEQLYQKEKTILLQQNYTNELKKQYLHIRQFHHDMKFHLHAMQLLAKENENDKLLSYLSNLGQEFTSYLSIQCADLYVSAAISPFIKKFSDENIHFYFAYHCPCKLKLHNIHIVSLFQNLLENALEASMRCEKADKTIRLKVKNIQTTVIIEASNPISSDFDVNALYQNKTTKNETENHGFGLLNMKKIIEQYHGDIQFKTSDEDIFISLVLLDAIDV